MPDRHPRRPHHGVLICTGGDAVTGHTTRDGAMTREPRFGVAVAVETKAMKPRLHSDLEICAAAAMTMNAGVEAAAIGVVVVAGKTVDRHVLAVIEVQRQRLCAT